MRTCVRLRTSSLFSSVSVEYHKLRIFGHRGYPWWNLTSRKNWLPGKNDFPGKLTLWKMSLPGKWESLLSWVSYLRNIRISGHHGYLDIWTLRIFRHHGYSDIMDIWTSWILGHHGYLDIMEMWISWIFGCYGYSDIMNIRISWIFRCHGYLDIWISWIS